MNTQSPWIISGFQILKHLFNQLVSVEHTSDLIHTQSQVFNAFSGSFLCQKAGWYRFGNLIMIVETKQGKQRGRFMRRWRTACNWLKRCGQKSSRRGQRRAEFYTGEERRGKGRSHSWVKARLPLSSVGKQVCCVLATTLSLPSYPSVF